MYEYYATVTNIVDGDTIDVEVDLGWKITIRDRLRFNRINAWEKSGKEKEMGLKAKEFVVGRIPPGTKIRITTDKEGKFGRYIAEIFYICPVSDAEINLNDELVENGHARYQEY